jgi:response regulator RpfG family c-di-GMP phosphodiesterase
MNNDSYTILFVDDEENIIDALKRLLRKEEYGVLTAMSGVEGLRILENNQVNAVISDQRMPGMLGTEFLKRAKEISPDVLTAILTGYADLETMKEGLNGGHISRFFLKPWKHDELKQGIRQMLYEYECTHGTRAIERRLISRILELKMRDIARARQEILK